MQVLWLLALRRFRRRRRAVSTITASATAPATPRGYVYYGEDDGPFFDLDLSCCSAPASSAESSSSSESEDSSCCAGGREVVDFVASLQRSRSASPSYERLSFGRCGWGGGALPPQLKFCASEPNDAAAARFSASSMRRGGRLRTLSFGSAKAAFYGGRASFSRSSNSTRSARLFAAAYGHGSPSPDQDHEEEAKRTPSADVIRRCLSKISRRLRWVAPPAASAADVRLRKSRSASAAQTATARAQVSSPSRRDDTLLEKQDGIASAIAHCKESIHRASMSELDSSLLGSWSDTGT